MPTLTQGPISSRDRARRGAGRSTGGFSGAFELYRKHGHAFCDVRAGTALKRTSGMKADPARVTVPFLNRIRLVQERPGWMDEIFERNGTILREASNNQGG